MTSLTPEACPIVRVTGLLGLCGAMALVAGDVLITPALPRAEDLRDLLALRAAIDRSDLHTSGLLGGLGAVFYAFGAWHIYYGVRPAGARLATASAASLAVMLIPTGVYHALFVALNFGAQVAAAPDAGPRAAALALALPEEYASKALKILVIPPAVAFTLLSGTAIIAGRTRYPRWFVLASPFLVVAVYAMLATMSGPSTFLSFALLGNVYNLSILLFFGLSTITLWACDRRDDVRSGIPE